MDTYRRYAIYWAPEQGAPLGRFGAGWLGWDAESGTTPPAPEVGVLPAPRAAIVERPRRYGFHATLKAPFRLAPGRSMEALDAALSELARRTASFVAPRLEVAELGPFLALVPSAPSDGLDRLAAACVRDLDAFRAPMTGEERARRLPGLTPRQTALMDRWGYPYVLEEFGFHLTLTGPLEPEPREATRAALEGALRPLLAEPLPVREICLFGEPEAGPFRLIRRHRLSRARGA